MATGDETICTDDMTHAALLRHLRRLGACGEAVTWAKTRKTAEAVWAECERGDWLLWLAARAGVDRKVAVLAACAVARTALRHVPKGETRPLRAIETAERWARSEAGVTLTDVHADAAYAADAARSRAYSEASEALRASADLVHERIPWATVKTALEIRHAA